MNHKHEICEVEALAQATFFDDLICVQAKFYFSEPDDVITTHSSMLVS